MPNNEQDALPLGAEAASIAGSNVSSTFGGRVDERLDVLRKQRTDITNYLNAWIGRNAELKDLDIESNSQQALHNLSLAEECDEMITTLVAETIRLVEMAHGALDKNNKQDQQYLTSMALWIESRKKQMRRTGRLVSLADDDEDIIDNIPPKEEIVGRKRERPIDDSIGSQSQPTKLLKGHELNDTSNFTDDIGGGQIEVGGPGRRVNFQLNGAAAATSPRTPTMNLQRLVDNGPRSEPTAQRKKKDAQQDVRPRGNDVFLMPPPRTLGLGRGQQRRFSTSSPIDRQNLGEESRREERERAAALQADRINQLQEAQEEERRERMRLEEQLREKDRQLQASSQTNNQGPTNMNAMEQALKKVIDQV